VGFKSAASYSRNPSNNVANRFQTVWLPAARLPGLRAGVTGTGCGWRSFTTHAAAAAALIRVAIAAAFFEDTEARLVVMYEACMAITSAVIIATTISTTATLGCQHLLPVNFPVSAALQHGHQIDAVNHPVCW